MIINETGRYDAINMDKHNYVGQEAGQPIGRGGGNWGILPWAPHLQRAPSYKQLDMRLKILTSTFCRSNKKQLSIPFKFL